MAALCCLQNVFFFKCHFEAVRNLLELRLCGDVEHGKHVGVKLVKVNFAGLIVCKHVCKVNKSRNFLCVFMNQVRFVVVTDYRNDNFREVPFFCD